MSEIGKAIYSLLSATGGTVYGIVGLRITPEARTQGTAVPSIVYSISEDESYPSLSVTGGFRKAQVEIMSIAATAAGASALNDAARTMMHGAFGTYSSTVILHCLHTKSLSNYQAPAAGETTGVFIHSSMFSIMYSE